MKASQPASPFGKFSRPAQRALANAGIQKLEDLPQFTEKELRALHGMGPATVKPLLLMMAKAGVKFKI